MRESVRETTDLKAIDPDQLSRWKKIFRAYLGTKSWATPKPVACEETITRLLSPTGEETEASEAYRVLLRKRVKAWKVKDCKAFDYF